jgi:hypothetical protein
MKCCWSNLLSMILAACPSVCVAQPCPADLARPYGVVNFFDIDAFVGLYLDGNPGADLAAPFGTLNFFDVAAFIQAFGDGCPADLDGDRIPDAAETNDGVYLSPGITGTDPNNPDTDGDGLLDGEELYGTPDGLDLLSMGASPFRKDIFIECDWFAGQFIGRFRDYRPTAASVARVVEAFAQAPVENPYGSASGISIHLDYGQGGAFTGGNQLPGNPVFITFDGDFNALKAQHFDPRRKGYFHYAIFASRYNSTTNGSSGVAEINGDDFMVTMVDYNSAYNQSQTIVHELGHNLGLRHGGFENRNYKPNYNSVMNYRHQFPGNDTDGDTFGNGVLGYSLGFNNTIDESAINEAAGVIGLPVDFNRNGVIDAGLYARNLNCSGTNTAPCGSDANGQCADSACGVLQDHDDWSSINWNRLNTSSDRVPAIEIIECANRP